MNDESGNSLRDIIFYVVRFLAPPAIALFVRWLSGRLKRKVENGKQGLEKDT